MRIFKYIIFFFLFVSTVFSKDVQINNFTNEEKEFIKNNPNITIGIGKYYPPFNFGEGEPIGYVADLVSLVAKKTGLSFNPIVDSWSNTFNGFKEKKIDVITNVSYKKERLNFTLFTEPYYIVPTAIYVRNDFGEYKGLESLAGKKIGIEKSIYYEKEVREIKNLEVITYDNTNELSKALVLGKIDVMIQNLPLINHLIKKHGYINLKIVDEFKLPSIKEEDLRFGVNIDKPILRSIIQKGLNLITQSEKIELANRWIGSIDLNKNSRIELSKEEKVFIINNPNVEVALMKDFAPFSYQENSEMVGFEVDLLSLISEKTGLNFILSYDSWSNNLKKFKKKQFDMIASTSYNQEKEDFTLFTKPYQEIPIGVYVRSDFDKYSGISSIKNKKVGISKDNLLIKELEQLGLSNLFYYKDNEELVKDLSIGKIDAVVHNLPYISFLKKKYAYINIKIVDELNFSSFKKKDLRFGIDSSKVILHSIIEKALEEILREEKEHLKNKWLPLKLEKELDYSFILKVGAGILFVILVIVYFNFKLRSKVTEQITELRKKDTLIIQQSKHAAMGELIANIAHQWRQPLANLNGLILNFDYDNEQNDLNKEKIESYLNQIEDLSLHMSNTVEDFSNYFSPYKEKKEFGFNSLLSDIENLLKFSLTKNNIELLFLRESNILINSYYAELLQVLLILINNSKDAFKLREIKEAKITIKIKENEKDIIIVLEDNAGGIPVDILPRVFEPYFSTKDKSQGTGLGLHIAKTLLTNSLNGNIFVENIEKGAKFIIKLKK